MRRYSYIVTLILCFLIMGEVSAQNRWLKFKNVKRSARSQSENLKPEMQFLDHADQGVEIRYSFPGASVTDIDENGVPYQFLHIDQFGKLNNPGKPALPVRYYSIAVPKGKRPLLRIVNGESLKIKGFNVSPALEPASDLIGAEEPKFEYDTVFYSSDIIYPDEPVKISSEKIYRGRKIIQLQVCPVQFNPARKELTVYSQLNFYVDFVDDINELINADIKESSAQKAILQNITLNGQAEPVSLADGFYPEIRGGLLIVTTDNYLAAADSLAQWKKLMGYDVEIISKNSWVNYEEVKDSVHSRYGDGSLGLEFCLIIGDHPEVPSYFSTLGSYDHVTDLYLACMDGAGDIMPDIAIGRLTATSPVEASMMVSKVINYERNPVDNPSFYTNAISAAYFQHASGGYAERRFAQTSWEISQYLQNEYLYNVDLEFYTESSVYPTNWNNGYYSSGEPIPTELQKPTFPWDGDAAGISNALNAGSFMLFHRDHGAYYGWGDPHYGIPEINALTNGDLLPVVFSINCQTGKFNNSTQSFAEEFLAQPNGGAVGVIAATEISYSGQNDGFAEGLIDALWPNPGLVPLFPHNPSPVVTSHIPMYAMGLVLNQGKLRMSETWNGGSSPFDYEQYTYELFHYLGDPSMHMWTAIPQEMALDHPNAIMVGQPSFDIVNANCLTAVATAMFNGEIIGMVHLVDGAGTIILDEPIFEVGDITLTITGHDFRPYQATIPLIPAGDALFVTAPSSSTLFDISENIDINWNTFGSIPNVRIEFSSDNGFTYSDIIISTPNVNTYTFQAPLVSSDSCIIRVSDIDGDPIALSGIFSIQELSTVSGNIAGGLQGEVYYSGPIEGSLFTDSTGVFSVSRLLPGEYIFSAVSGEFLSDTITVTLPGDTSITFNIQYPQIDLNPSSLTNSVLFGDSISDTIQIINSGESVLQWNIVADLACGESLSVVAAEDIYEAYHFEAPEKGGIDYRNGTDVSESFGGPDNFGYRWRDSNEPNGPTYVWDDIRTTGLRLSTVSGCDDCGEWVPISFSFPFYGKDYDSIYVSSNGYITVGIAGGGYSTYPIPSASLPQNLISGFLRDQNPGSGGDVYFQDYGNRLVVQFTNVYQYSTSNPYTYQMVLFNDGRIRFYYHDMNGDLNSATVGIQDSLRTDGLQIVYNASYVQDSLAVEIAAAPQWLELLSSSGTTAVGETSFVAIDFRSAGLNGGLHCANLNVEHNAPGTVSPVSVPCSLSVDGVRRLSANVDSVDFGIAWIGRVAYRELFLRNNGNEATVINSITSTSSLMGSSIATPVTVAPNDSILINVWYRPETIGVDAALLTVASNAEDNDTIEINLIGHSVEGPEINVNVESLSDTVNAGDSSLSSMVIRNNGDVDLRYDLNILSEYNPSEASDTIRFVMDRSHGQSATLATISTFVSDLTAKNVIVSENTAVITDSVLENIDVLWLDDTPSSDFTASEKAALDSWLRSGGSIMMQSDQPQSMSTTMEVYGIGFIETSNSSNYISTLIADHEASEGVDSVAINGPYAILVPDTGVITLVSEPDGDPHICITEVDRGRIAIIANEDFHDSNINGAQNRILANAIFDWLAANGSSSDWLNCEPISGTIMPGDSAIVNVTMGSVDLWGGIYNGALEILSDAVNIDSAIIIPCNLLVDGERNLISNTDTLVFDQVWAGSSSTLNITLVNEGSEITTIDSINVFGAEFTTIDQLPINLNPDDNVNIAVSYSPQNIGVNSGYVQIISNAENNPRIIVELLGYAIEPPVATLSDTLLTYTLDPRDVPQDRTFTLANLGGDNLRYSISCSNISNPVNPAENKRVIIPQVDYSRVYSEENYKNAFIEGRVIVGLKEGESDFSISSIADNAGVVKTDLLTKAKTPGTMESAFTGRKILQLTLDKDGKDAVLEAIEILKKDPNVAYAEPDYIQYALAIPNDSSFTQLYGMNNEGQTGGTIDADIDAPEAWEKHTGNRSIRIGIIDTGIDYLHPDLADNMWQNPGEIPANGIDDDGNGFIDDVYGWDFANEDNDPTDDNYHGTHCAGTVAGVGNNGIGVAGVMWEASLVALKFLDAGGSGSTSAAIGCVDYANAMGIEITSNSWGGGGFSQALYDVISASGLFIAAAGNSGSNNNISPEYPATYDCENIISVAATDHNDNLASFSCYGDTTVDLAAPGVNIYSCSPGNSYRYLDGTSMATPHVSGVAGLVLSYNPFYTALEVKEILLSTVDPVSSLSGVVLTGGRVNADAAISAAGPTIPEWITINPLDPDSLDPDSSQIFAVTANPEGLLPGEWVAEILVESNDPVNPIQAVRVNAVVGSCKSLILERDSVSFGSVTKGVSVTDSIVLINNCNDTVTIDSFIVDNGNFNIDSEIPVKVGPFESLSIAINVNSANVGFEVGSVSIIHDAGDELNVNLSAQILNGPSVIINPRAINENLIAGDSIDVELLISNTGDQSLSYDIDVSDIITEDIYNIEIFPVSDNWISSYIDNGNNSELNAKPKFAKKVVTYKSGVSFNDSLLESILVCEDNSTTQQPYVDALTNLGLTYTLVTQIEAITAGLIDSTDWDLVIINSYSNSMNTGALDALSQFVQNGGKVIFTDWNAYSNSSHQFFVDMGVTLNSSFDTPINFRAADSSHVVFNEPNVVYNLNTTDNQANTDGQITSVLAGATQLAAFDGYAGSGAVVLNEEQTCFYNAFQAVNFLGDHDVDGKLDVVELIENEITYLSGGASPSWLRVSVDNGNIAPGFTDTIIVQLNSTDLIDSIYVGEISISTNVIGNDSLVIISCSLSVENTMLPVIVSQPQSVYAEVGDSVSFSVSATGPGLEYQWQRNGIGIDSAFESIFTVNPVTADLNGSFYRCVVSNIYGSVISDSALLSIDINQPPVAMADSFSTLEDSILSGVSVLSNDYDPDGDSLTVVLINNVSNGVLSLSSNGYFTYEPSINFNGNDFFTYVAFDPEGLSSDTTIVGITVVPVNDVPEIDSVISQSINENSSLTIDFSMVIATDVDNDTLSLIVENGINYSVIGSTVFVDSGFTGNLSVPIRVTDRNDTSDAELMTITVIPVIMPIINASVIEHQGIGCEVPAWHPDTVYTGGDSASYDQRIYRARYWTRGNRPDLSGEWGHWEDIGECSGGGVEYYGTITPEGEVEVSWDSSQTFTFTPDSGYGVVEVLVDGNPILPVPTNSYTFNNVQEDHSIMVEFGIVEMVTLSINTVGSGNVTGAGNIPQGSETSISAMASTGYQFVRWEVVSGSAQIVDSTLENTTVIVISNAQINAVFEAIVWDLIVEPQYLQAGVTTGSGTYQEGSVVNISTTVNSGYRFLHWVCDSNNVIFDDSTSINTSVTVNGEDRVTALFRTILTYEIYAGSGPNGSVTLDDTTIVYEGDSITVDANPETGYVIDSVRIDGVMYGANVLPYTFRNVQDYHSIYVTFIEVPTYNLTVVANDSTFGTVTGSGIYAENSLPAISATANDGYRFVQWTGASEVVDSFSANTSILMSGEKIVTAFFEPIPTFTVIAEADSNGTISPSGNITVQEGDSITFTITASDGYEVEDVIVDGQSVGAVSEYSMNGINSNRTIIATFIEVSGSICDGVSEWDANTPWYEYTVGDQRVSNGALYECVNIAYSYLDPSTANGRYGWYLVGSCE